MKCNYNIKKKLFLILLAAVLTIAALFLYLRSRGNAGDAGAASFALKDVSKVSAIHLTRENEKLLLEMGEPGIWMVNGHHQADPLAIEDLLSVIRNLSVKRPAPLAEREDVNARIDSSGIRVEVFRDAYWSALSAKWRCRPGRKRTNTFIVGGESGQRNVTFMRHPGCDVPYEVHVPGKTGHLNAFFSMEEHLWRDPVVIDLKASEIARIEIKVAARSHESFVLTHEAGQGAQLFYVSGKEVQDSLIDEKKVQAFLHAFGALFVDEWIPGKMLTKWVDLIFSEPFLEIEVTGPEGHIKQLTCFYLHRKPGEPGRLTAYRDFDPDRFVLQIDGDEYARAQFLIFNRIMRPLSYFYK